MRIEHGFQKKSRFSYVWRISKDFFRNFLLLKNLTLTSWPWNGRPLPRTLLHQIFRRIHRLLTCGRHINILTVNSETLGYCFNRLHPILSFTFCFYVKHTFDHSGTLEASDYESVGFWSINWHYLTTPDCEIVQGFSVGGRDGFVLEAD